jgi:tetratricopeptide (TPR) repeat protein
MLTLILIFGGERKMREEIKKVLTFMVLAMTLAAAAFAQSGTGSIDQNIAKYTEEIRRNPNNALAYNNRGSAYKNKGEYDKAIADYTQAIRIDPDFVRKRKGDRLL